MSLTVAQIYCFEAVSIGCGVARNLGQASAVSPSLEAKARSSGRSNSQEFTKQNRKARHTQRIPETCTESL